MADSSLKAIGKKLRKARIAAGFTQADVAEKADITTSYYGQIERGDRNPTTSLILNIIKIIGAKSSEILED